MVHQRLTQTVHPAVGVNLDDCTREACPLAPRPTLRPGERDGHEVDVEPRDSYVPDRRGRPPNRGGAARMSTAYDLSS